MPSKKEINAVKKKVEEVLGRFTPLSDLSGEPSDPVKVFFYDLRPSHIILRFPYAWTSSHPDLEHGFYGVHAGYNVYLSDALRDAVVARLITSEESSIFQEYIDQKYMQSERLRKAEELKTKAESLGYELVPKKRK